MYAMKLSLYETHKKKPHDLRSHLYEVFPFHSVPSFYIPLSFPYGLTSAYRKGSNTGIIHDYFMILNSD